MDHHFFHWVNGSGIRCNNWENLTQKTQTEGSELILYIEENGIEGFINSIIKANLNSMFYEVSLNRLLNLSHVSTFCLYKQWVFLICH